ncbi:hypothetical protein JTB14_014095 [Gonioctena quinquepunctata]|nr:hypothetical protein JTB14_014095 [Gonioctena quinquepunctata]
MEQMSEHIRQLEKVVQDMYKPKKEITDISGRLILQLEKLQKVEMRNWLEEVVQEKKEEKKETERREQILELQSRMMNMEVTHRADI